jgi:Zn ribbon nucleic-acid-binding protein
MSIEHDWNIHYGTDTGVTGVCPKCESTDVYLDSYPNRTIHECLDCGFTETEYEFEG